MAARALRLSPRQRTWLRRAGVTVLGSYVGYLVLANVLINTPYVERLVNGAQPIAEIHYRRAWTFWPGHAAVHDFVLRIEDQNVQALLTLDRAKVTFALTPLLRKTIRFKRADAEGVRYVMRHKLEAITDELAARVAAYPPIPGAGEPLFDPRRADEPPPDPDKIWRFEMDDGEASGDELWIQEYRLHAPFRARGGFRFKPLESFELTKSTLRGEPGTVSIGAQLLATEVKLDADAELQPFAIQDPDPLAPLRGLDVRLQLDASLPHSEALAVYGGLHEQVKYTNAKLHTELTVARGAIAKGSTLRFEGAELRLRHTAASFHGPLQAELSAPRDRQVEVMVRTDKSKLTLHAAPNATLSLAHADATLSTPLGLDDAPAPRLERTELTVDAPSLTGFGALAGAGATMQGGARAVVSLQRGAKGALGGHARVDLSGWQFRRGTTALGGRGTLKATLAAGAGDTALPDGLHPTHAELDFPFLALQFASASASSWLKASLKQTSFTPDAARGTFQLSSGHSALLAAPVAAQGFFGNVAANLLRGGTIEAQGSYRYGRGLDLELSSAKAGSVRAHGFAYDHGQGLRGAFVAEASVLSAGLKLGKDGVTIAPLSGDGWLAAQRPRAAK